MKALLEAGVHFGHRTRRWNPKMKPYIFTERNGIHIIDLQQTSRQLEAAYNLVRDTVRDGGTILFVGTKRQAQEAVRQHAERCGMPYVIQRWLGGTLTNFRTIRQRVDFMINLEQQREQGEFDRLPKKEALKQQQLIEKLNRRLGGLRNLYDLPDILFVTDVRREAIAVREANKLGITIVAMVDTNADPDPVDLVIPSNDDAIRAIKLIVGKIADAVEEGRQLREAEIAEMVETGEVEPEALDELLGPSTLAKLATGEYGVVEEEAVEAVKQISEEGQPEEEATWEEEAPEIVAEAEPIESEEAETVEPLLEPELSEVEAEVAAEAEPIGGEEVETSELPLKAEASEVEVETTTESEPTEGDEVANS